MVAGVTSVDAGGEGCDGGQHDEEESAGCAEASLDTGALASSGEQQAATVPMFFVSSSRHLRMHVKLLSMSCICADAEQSI